MENKFLKDFMNRQMNFVHHAPIEAKHGTADGKPAFGAEEDETKAMMKELLAKKQSKKKLVDYYRKRIEELCDEDF
jgi:hypothetical protein